VFGAVTLQKIRLDPDKTVIWLQIQNESQNIITFEPSANSEGLYAGVELIPQLADDQDDYIELAKGGAEELMETITLEPDDWTLGFLMFDAIPLEGSVLFTFENFLNEDTRNKWDYTFEINLDKLTAPQNEVDTETEPTRYVQPTEE